MFTLRELLDMAQSRQRDQWNHTASILAMLANVNRDPAKGRMLQPADFHPNPPPKGAEAVPLKGDITLLKTVFVDNVPQRNA